MKFSYEAKRDIGWIIWLICYVSLMVTIVAGFRYLIEWVNTSGDRKVVQVNEVEGRK